MRRDAVPRSSTKTDRTQTAVQVSVVVPTYNELDNLPKLVSEIEAVFESDELFDYTPFETIVVDDGSTDGTRDRLRELAAENAHLRAVFLTRNFGQSAALAAGIDAATGNTIVTMDADLQNDPADVPKLLSKLEEGYDCVSGWRRDRNDPLSKTVPSAIQTRLGKWTGPNIHDFGCTLKAYRAEPLRSIDLYGEGHRYLPAKLYNKGYRIDEVEVNHRPRVNGETKYGAPRLVRGFVDLLFHVFWNRYSTRPLHFLGGGGLLLLLVGTALGAHAVVVKYAFGVELVPRTPRLILTALLILFGFQMLMFGLLAETLVKVHHKGGKNYRVQEQVSSD